MILGFATPTTNASTSILRNSLGRDRREERAGELAAMAERLHAEHDEVQRAGELDGGEDGDRLLHQRADADRHEHDLHVCACGIADRGREAGAAAERQGAGDDEQHARPRHDDQHERGQQERQQMIGGQHAASLDQRRR